MMKTKKTTFYMSLLSVLLCVTMLVGTTFAWFTDTVTSATNKIQAGNLDVDLLMDKAENGTYTSIAGETAAIFGGENSLVAQNKSTDTLWEPGKTQIVYLGVKNNGTLALKYYIQLTVNGDLAPALEYAIIDGAKASDLSGVADWSTLKSADGVQTGDLAVGGFTVAGGGTLDEIINGEQDETDYFALAVHMKEDAGNDYQNKSITIDVTVHAAQKDAESDSFDEQYDKAATFDGFGPQYKYEINQLAKYMNMDGDALEDLLLAWTKNTSNRNKTYAELLSDIQTKNDALCAAAVYILGTEHFLVSDTTISEHTSMDIAKGILNSDVVMKYTNIIFLTTADNTITDEQVVAGLPTLLSSWNNEILKVLGLDESSGVPVADIYDAFKYSIDHANEETTVINTYNLTANAIYKIMKLASTEAISLDDIKASMDRMIARSEAGTILDMSVIAATLQTGSEAEKKQFTYDYATYCYMCMFGLMSGDPANTALSKHFTEYVFPSDEAIGYVLTSDYLFKRIAQVTEAVQSGNAEGIFGMAFSCLSNCYMLQDICCEYTNDYNEMYKAISEIFNY